MKKVNITSDVNQAAQFLADSGVIVFPTETFFALGGLGISIPTVQRVAAIKSRPDNKPLPLVAGSFEQVQMAVELSPDEIKLGRQFWPGPLSILTRARTKVPLGIKDGQGLVSIRVTPHPDAARLCLKAGFPLIATSANLSGGPSCADVELLDPVIMSKADLIFSTSNTPPGGKASTLVRMIGPDTLKVYRAGAMSSDELERKGWKVQSL
ncbi:L-threonylcarbamoyladenylate synthase [Desulfonatronovibrio magnus]|uniref:L-threonylcarbamoyladenylate synthase n=1 Tax=Desulfonatronovibrio magnus TaxID=698827 RepID=UPI0005EB6579|nr:L-threonylcarbamoyladenylate synthase [Desulfonatronovibrio magnus]